MSLSQQIFDHYEDPFHQGPCDYPTHRGAAEHAACGDRISVELRIAKGTIEEAWFDGEGCQLALGAASLLMEHIEEQSIDALGDLTHKDAAALCQMKMTKEEADCSQVVYQALMTAIQSPLDELESDGPTLAGPHLGDEC
jgi:nitrogen fixation NifU-like protein